MMAFLLIGLFFGWPLMWGADQHRGDRLVRRAEPFLFLRLSAAAALSALCRDGGADRRAGLVPGVAVRGLDHRLDQLGRQLGQRGRADSPRSSRAATIWASWATAGAALDPVLEQLRLDARRSRFVFSYLWSLDDRDLLPAAAAGRCHRASTKSTCPRSRSSTACRRSRPVPTACPTWPTSRRPAMVWKARRRIRLTRRFEQHSLLPAYCFENLRPSARETGRGR